MLRKQFPALDWSNRTKREVSLEVDDRVMLIVLNLRRVFELAIDCPYQNWSSGARSDLTDVVVSFQVLFAQCDQRLTRSKRTYHRKVLAHAVYALKFPHRVADEPAVHRTTGWGTLHSL